MRLKRNRKPEAVIPVAAMSDIAFLLIIFFMLVSKIVQQEVEIKKPTGVTVEEKELAPTSVLIGMKTVTRVNDQGLEQTETVPVIYLNGVETDLGSLTAALNTLLSTATAEGAREVALEADEKAPNEVVSQVIRIISGQGGDLTLIADVKQRKAAPAGGGK